MKNLVISLCFFLVSQCGLAQKIFVTQYEYQADVIVCVVDQRYQANMVVKVVDQPYKVGHLNGVAHWNFVQYEYQADIKIFFTDYPYKANWLVYFTRNSW